MADKGKWRVLGSHVDWGSGADWPQQVTGVDRVSSRRMFTREYETKEIAVSITREALEGAVGVRRVFYDDEANLLTAETNDGDIYREIIFVPEGDDTPFTSEALT